MYLNQEKLEQENIQLEYKTAKNTLPKDFWYTYSAFANTKGGFVILGISENSKFDYQIEGVNNPQKIINELITSLHNSNKVSQNLIDDSQIQIQVIDNKKIIIIEIQEASFSQKPVYLSGKLENTYIRSNDGDFKASISDLKYMIAHSNSQLDGELLENFTIDDLNTDDIDQYRKLLINNSGKSSYKKQSYEDFLFNIGAIRNDRKKPKGNKKLTAGGLLFFGKFNSIIEYFPGFQLDFFRKKNMTESSWTTRISSGDMNFPEMNIFSFYNQVLTQLEQGIPDKYVQDKNFTRGSYHSDLEIALKEALVNSLMHAYYSSDKPISIFDYDDYFEFSNPGDMRVSKEEFIHGNNPITRNSVIALLFRKVGIAEKAGSGGPRIFKSAHKNKLSSPDIIKENNSTKIRIWKINLLDSLHGFTDLEKDVIQYAIGHPIFSITDIKTQLDIGDYKTRNIIKNLENNGVVIKNGNGRATRYHLNESQETGIFRNKLLLRHLEDMLSK